MKWFVSHLIDGIYHTSFLYVLKVYQHRAKATKLPFVVVFKSQVWQISVRLEILSWNLAQLQCNPCSKDAGPLDWLLSLLIIKETRAPTAHLDQKLNTTI